MRHDETDETAGTHSITMKPLAEEQTITNHVAQIHAEIYIAQG